jgi:pimeloyl-ACP methyl ester carboxylesterase
VTSPRGTAQPGRTGPAVASVIAVICFALIVWAGVTGAGDGGEDPPTGTPVGQGTAPIPALDPRLSRYYDQVITWEVCEDSFECAELNVPLDYNEPERVSIDIALIRLPTRDTDARLGSLVLNPGGPGGSGIEYVKAAQFVTTDSLRRAYDIVGFDPRGVGASAPVDCLDNDEIDEWLAADGTPDTPAERGDIISFSTDFGALCATRSPNIAPFIDTISAARDIDILREVLGDERLNWLGKSYGTYLGAQYAELFPGRVGRMVLDGAVDPDIDLLEMTRAQALGFELALDRFIADCFTTGECPLGDSVEEGRAKILAWIEAAETTPFKTDDPDRPLTESLVYYGILLGLYDTQFGWEALRLSLQGLAFNDGAGMLSLIDTFTGRDEDGYADNGLEALNAVSCLDHPVRPTLQQVEQLGEELKGSAPIFGEWLAWGALSCTYWPYEATSDGTISVNGVPEILVIGTRYDPATPVQWATRLRDKIENARLIEWNGDGHTAYMQQGARCVDRIVDAYFIQGLLPDDGTVCN